MAIIEDLGLAVTVQVNNKDLKEYDNPEPDAKVIGEFNPEKTAIVEKYIEAMDDAEYSIVVQVLPGHKWLSLTQDNTLCFRVHVDGRDVNNILLFPKSLWKGFYQYRFDGEEFEQSGQEKLRRFRFSAITKAEQADQDTVRKHAKRAKHLGTIQVEVFRKKRVKRIRNQKSMTQEASSKQEESSLSIAEKALKGRSVSHGTQFGPVENVQRSNYQQTTAVDDFAYAVFNFSYQSKEALREEMIVPRTPSPSPSRVVDELDNDAVRRLARELLNERRLKREQDSPPIKQEGTSRKAKRRATEAFDLTGDDDVMVNMEPPTKKARPGVGQETINLDD